MSESRIGIKYGRYNKHRNGKGNKKAKGKVFTVDKKHSYGKKNQSGEDSQLQMFPNAFVGGKENAHSTVKATPLVKKV